MLLQFYVQYLLVYKQGHLKNNPLIRLEILLLLNPVLQEKIHLCHHENANQINFKLAGSPVSLLRD